jgi:hypothetical protein
MTFLLGLLTGIVISVIVGAMLTLWASTAISGVNGSPAGYDGVDGYDRYGV